MAKFECVIPGTYGFEETLKYFHDYLSTSSLSSSYEDGSDFRTEKMKVAVRVYEKYTILGENRLSMTVTLATDGTDIYATAITAAGSGGFVKVWAWGEDGYLEHFIEAAKQFEGMRPLNRK